MSTVGNNIMNRRKALGMTQEELAKRMGYKSKSTINKIELGVNDIPQSKILMFAEVLLTTPAQLMGWENEEENKNTYDKRTLTEGEEMLLDLFNQVPEESQQMVLEMIQIALKKK